MTTDNSFSISELIVNDKNGKNVVCPHCKSLILRAGVADYVENEAEIPLLHRKTSANTTDFEKESLKDYWTVNDMYMFENIGFSHTIEKIKYLVCADCEMGPLGYHDIDTKICYIALGRIEHA